MDNGKAFSFRRITEVNYTVAVSGYDGFTTVLRLTGGVDVKLGQ